MITGRTLTEMAKEVERQNAMKHDYLVPEKLIRLAVEDDDVRFVMPVSGSQPMAMNATMHDQVAAHLHIPAQYYRRMQTEAPKLLADNVNTWFSKKESGRRMVRTLDMTARAFLSDRFQPLDNYQVLENVLPVLMQKKELQIMSCQLTKSRMYVQAVYPKVSGEVRKGDVVQAGVVISNSEIGYGSVKIEPLVFTLSCTNGQVRSSSLNKYHVGRQIGGDDIDQYGWIKRETVLADHKAFFLRVRDTVEHAFDTVAFGAEVERLRSATLSKINPEIISDVLEDVTSRYRMSEGEGNSILANLLKSGDLTKYGLANAVTAIANTSPSYDRAYDLEKIGGQIIDLTDAEWKRLN